MDKKSIVRTSPSLALAVAIALSQLVASNVAQADSPREWAYWNEPTSAGPGDGGSGGFNSISTQDFNNTQNTNTGQNINSDQRVVGVNPIVTAYNASTAQTGYVGYTLSYEGYDTERGGYYNPRAADTINVNVVQGAERLAEHTHYEGEGYVRDVNYYDAKLVVDGTFDGAALNINDNAARLTSETDVYFNRYAYENTSVEGEAGGVLFGTYLSGTLSDIVNNTTASNPINEGSIYANGSLGLLLLGKPIVATQIAEQLRLGQTYNFYGSSYSGSSVQVAVNFQNASWNGTWGDNKIHNGFVAAGGISGSTLASNSVTGAGPAGVGFVTGGNVNATLVGAITGTDASAAGVIGKTVVTVQQAVGTTTASDIFSATQIK